MRLLFNRVDSEFWGMTYRTRDDSRDHDIAEARRRAAALGR